MPTVTILAGVITVHPSLPYKVHIGEPISSQAYPWRHLAPSLQRWQRRPWSGRNAVRSGPKKG
jgi:hypothetical protein